MPDFTPEFDFPYPTGAESPNGPGALKALADAVEAELIALGEWEAYTPAWTGSGGNPVIGNGTITGRKKEVSNLTFFHVDILVGSTTTFGSGTYSIELPSVPAATYEIFEGLLFDTSAGARYRLSPFATGAVASTFLFCDATTAGNPLRAVTPTVPVTLANGDRLVISGFYEAA